MRSWFVRFGNLFRKRYREEDLTQELEANIQFHIEDHIRAGMTPSEARRAALLKFGSVESSKEAVRDRRGIPFLETLARDIRYAFRMMGQNKAWSAVAFLSLALGIGVNAAVFGVVNQILLEPLPVRNPQELIAFRWIGDTNMSNGRNGYGYIATPRAAGGAPMRSDATFSHEVFQRLETQAKPLAELFAFAPQGLLNFVANGHAELATSQVVSGNFYRQLGVSAIAGRTIEPADDSSGADPVAVISYQYWQNRFAMDPGVIGAKVTINGAPFTVIGIAPPDLGILLRNAKEPRDISIPMAMEPRIQRDQSKLTRPAMWWVLVMGRLKPGATPDQLRATLEGTYDRSVRDEWQTAVATFPPERRASPEIAQHQDRVPRLQVIAGSRGVYDAVPQDIRTLSILSGIVGLVLLIVCVNLANLLLSRGATRRKEIAMRLAIGASRARLIRQLLTESLVLTSIGGCIGLLAAYLSKTLFPVWIGFNPIETDWTVVGFAGGITLIIGLIFGLLPAFRSTRVSFAPAMREGSGQFSPTRSRLGKSLLVAQVAVSVAMMIGAVLFLRTLQNLRGVDVGFDTQNLVLFGVNPSINRYDPAGANRLYERILERLEQTPGVRSASFASTALLTDDHSQQPFTVEGRQELAATYVLGVHPDFFETMGIQSRLGRIFTPGDNQTAPRVVVINEAFARTYFPNVDPLGKHLGGRTGNVRMEIVGIVADARNATLRDSPPPTVYLPHLQRPIGIAYFVVRTSADSSAFVPTIREAVRTIDPGLPLSIVSTQSESIERLLTWEKTFAATSSLFGTLALVISMIGLFGLMSYAVARRTKEIGIRMALGAQRSEVLASVLKETLTLVAIGTALGVGISFGLTRLIAAQLFGISPHDPFSIALAVSLTLIVAAFAGYLPARRASRVDPMIALHYE